MALPSVVGVFGGNYGHLFSVGQRAPLVKVSAEVQVGSLCDHIRLCATCISCSI